MLWLIFALLSALCGALRNLLAKKQLGDVDEYIIAWASRFFSLPLFLPLLFLSEKPSLGNQFTLAFTVSLILQVFGNLLYFRALKASDLSLTAPMISFTPLFLLVTSPIIVGEFPSRMDIVGIFLIVGGSYLLNIKNREQGYLAPLLALVKEKGTRLMLVVAVIWSFLANFNKLGMANSSAIFWATATSSAVSCALLSIMLYQSQANLKQIPKKFGSLFLNGILQGLILLCSLKAFELTLVANVVATKRISILISVLFGHWFLGEPGLQQRLTGAAIMFIGVSIVTLL